MREGTPNQGRGRVSKKLEHTLVLVGLALAAQATIVVLAPSGKAQTRVPTPDVPFDVVVEGPANVVAGQSFGTQSLYGWTTAVTDTISIGGQLDDGAQYFGVFSTIGDAIIGPNRNVFSLTLASAFPGAPLGIEEFLGADALGLLAETTRVQIGDLQPLVFSSTVLSQAEPSDVTLHYRRPALSFASPMTNVWHVSPNSSVVTDTLVIGTIDGASYQKVVSDRGVCQSVLASFVCKFEDLGALRTSPVISATLEASKPGTYQQAIQVATVGDVFTYTTTSRLVAADVVQPVEVELDVKPFTTQNVVNLRRRFLLFALLSTPSFDVTEEVDSSSLLFGHSGTEDSVFFCFRLDLHRDGLRDFLCIADAQAAGFEPGDTEAVVTGETSSGEPVHGTDAITTRPPS